MKDQFDRNINYLRLSLTPDCNLNCRYCKPQKSFNSGQSFVLSSEQIENIVQVCARLGIKKVRLTGGEPLVRDDIVKITKRIKSIQGIEEVCMTTNGVLLSKYAQKLKEAGLDRLNISLDTLNRDKYLSLCKSDSLSCVLDGIKAAFDAGFENLKLNTVLIKGFNDDEINDFIALTKDNDITVRFIELMAIGDNAKWCRERFLGNNFVLSFLSKASFLKTDGVSMLYAFDGYRGKIGLISPLSNSFCNSCNKIRITSDGKLKPCLHSNEEINLVGLSFEDLYNTTKSAVINKPKNHLLCSTHGSDSKRNMNEIGG